MTFHLRGNGGNYVGAEWIAAEGEIMDETADDLEAYMKSFGYTENPGGWCVRFNSPGGSLSGGIRLGELIRKLGLVSASTAHGTCVEPSPIWCQGRMLRPQSVLL
jgi:hypothetical protein